MAAGGRGARRVCKGAVLDRILFFALAAAAVRCRRKPQKERKKEEVVPSLGGPTSSKQGGSSSRAALEEVYEDEALPAIACWLHGVDYVDSHLPK